MSGNERRGSFWTKERDEELLRVCQNLKGKALAAHFGVTASYCRVRLRTLLGRVPMGRPKEISPQPVPLNISVQERVRAVADQRRGFAVPADKQGAYIELLKKGVPVAEARQLLEL